MRLYRHLNEQVENIDEIIAILESNCNRVIKEYNKANDFLYRGTRDSKGFVEKTGRTKVRIPRNTPIEVHRMFNTVFKDKLGWKVRDGISTTPQEGWAGFYGNVYIFFPTNKYKFAWSPRYGDLYTDFPLVNVVVPGSLKKYLETKKATFSRAVNTYKTTDLPRAIQVGQMGRVGEVMFKVGKYYLGESTEYTYKKLREAFGM